MIERSPTTPAEVGDEFLAAAHAALLADPDAATMVTTAHARQVWAAGFWLNRVLEEEGAPSEEADSVGFAFGQMCLGRDPWQVLQELLDAWRAGAPIVGGRGLADRLFLSDPQRQLAAAFAEFLGAAAAHAALLADPDAATIVAAALAEFIGAAEG